MEECDGDRIRIIQFPG